MQYVYMHTWAHPVRRWYILWRVTKPEKGPWGLFNYRPNGFPPHWEVTFEQKPKCRQWSDGTTEDSSVEQLIWGKDKQEIKLRGGNVLGVLPKHQGGQCSCSSGGQVESGRLGGWRVDHTGPWWTWQGFRILSQLHWCPHELGWWQLLTHDLNGCF